ncbi:MAG: methylmalonyl Co-A mutase-associated GTPase MeaB [Parvibaculaceae bacterium]
MKKQQEMEPLAKRILKGDRAALGQAITLIESRRADRMAEAEALYQRLLPHARPSRRVGITGVPGAGKSTFIDRLGQNLTARGHKVAVLAVDPTSRRTGGSILGDKTRMAGLANDPNAFVRPSPSGATLGGVARRTRETMLLCEAAGHDVVLVETVGVGQSETAVADMVDFFLVVLVAGAGDSLQGIKKGVLELADLIAVNKADGDNLGRVREAVSEYRAALGLLMPHDPNWTPPVLAVSALANTGVDEIWAEVERHHSVMERTGAFKARRAEQQVRWMWAMLEERLLHEVRTHPEVKPLLPSLEAEVRAGRLAPQRAVAEIAARARTA